jgi:hypothetical protein
VKVTSLGEFSNSPIEIHTQLVRIQLRTRLELIFVTDTALSQVLVQL